MTEAPKRIWIPHGDVQSLVDVSDGSLVKGPGPYYVRADIADERLAALKVAAHCLESPSNETVRLISAAIAKDDGS